MQHYQYEHTRLVKSLPPRYLIKPLQYIIQELEQIKTLTPFYQELCSGENIYYAYKQASKGKHHYDQVKAVEQDLGQHLHNLQKLLLTNSYHPSPYKTEVIKDKGKERTLYKLPFYPDRIVQWAVMSKVEQVFLSEFSDFSCAAIKYKGIDYAFNLTKHYVQDLHEHTSYCLKIDIKKFYPNINKEILKQLLRKTFTDPHILLIFDRTIDSYPESRGIPIGSYFSQYFANYYATFLDRWLTRYKKQKYIVRYMDDICIYSDNKPQLHALLDNIKQYIKTKLDLELKHNYQIFPTDIRGVDFVGYVFHKNYIRVRKSTVKTFKRKMLNIAKKKQITFSDFCSINSYIGILAKCNANALINEYVSNSVKELALEYYHTHINDKKSKFYKYLINTKSKIVPQNISKREMRIQSQIDIDSKFIFKAKYIRGHNNPTYPNRKLIKLFSIKQDEVWTDVPLSELDCNQNTESVNTDTDKKLEAVS